MIRYTLKCVEGHAFESWFRDSTAYETLWAADQVTCSVCGSAKVEKSIMAPALAGGKETPPDKPLSTPSHPAEAALRKMRAHLSENADYVGKEFASEARRIHDGESEQRGIWGEATREDAKSLAEDGIPVTPLPFISRTND
ncbi:MAG: DUF1178 family protein [Paracoccaceae bacterium]